MIAPSLILLYTHRGHLDKSSDVSLDLAIGYLPVWHFSFSISPSQLPLSKCLCFLHLMHKSLNSARPSLKPRRADQPWLDSQGDKGKARCRCSTPFSPTVEMAGVNTPLKSSELGIVNNPTAGSYAEVEFFTCARVPSPANYAAAGSAKGHTNQQRCHLWLSQLTAVS